METEPSKPIEREVRIAAPPATVYRYFVDPERMVQWMSNRAEIDPRPGGRIRLDYDGFDVMRGEFVELVPDRRVVFTWGWETLGDNVPAGASRVEVTLTPDGEGTLLRLVHSGLPAGASEGHATGWDSFLGNLGSAARTGRRAQPNEARRSEAYGYAVQLNALLCGLRELLDTIPVDAWGRRAPASGWPVAAAATHAISHLNLCPFIAATAAGERSPIADLEEAAIDRANAAAVTANAAVSRETLLARLRSEGPPAVGVIKGLPDESLGRSQPMAFAGGASLTVRDLITGALLDDIGAHVADIRAAISAGGA